METSLPGKPDAFELLGLSREDAVIDVVRGDLRAAVAAFIRDRQLPEARAADYFHVSEPTMRDVLDDRLGNVPLDTLVRMVARTGAQLRIYVARQNH